MQKIYQSRHPDLVIKMLSGNKKNFFFQISVVLTGICAYMDIYIKQRSKKSQRYQVLY